MLGLFSIFPSKTSHIQNAIYQVLQKNLQYCYSAILKVELQYCKKKNILFYFPRNFSLLSLIIYVLFSLFLLSFSSSTLSPFFRPKHQPPPNINITYHSGSFFLVGCNLAGSVIVFFFFFFFFAVTGA